MSVDELARMPYLDFKAAMSAQLTPQADRDRWPLFYDPRIAGRSLAVLQAIVRDLDQQLAERDTALASDVADLLAAGRPMDAKSRQAKHYRWKAGFLHFRKIAGERLSDLEGIVADLGTSPVVVYRSALLQLAGAIQAHRDTVLKIEGSDADLPESDLDLWSTLDRVTVQGQSVADLLAAEH